mmetsp:Transcript_40805/g.59924  ORF Transcript_40805/g.59924 Transcript_40805/m.59924 type:complete len:363 (+) Transcript_40805:148-1236(+)|eukprot:CAMPEP_0195523832 /NCGR_PEP_ID=MMETSP0794_2-20130614/23285_1 /TAXON_ID=515487 /ORGANISM="Stephanopyxis turris, Strain CCMP 815" /LENGTH=362 /DNA_ID=CAMNT_0040653913 /DNA_START=119 /DNA_END=1207 /DNA_ORIENTATION=-
MASNKNDITILEKDLEGILGFDDVSDVFHHLIEIPTEEDLRSYLTELLGPSMANSEQVHAFVKNVQRYVKGEPIVSNIGGDKNGDDTKTIDTKASETKSAQSSFKCATTGLAAGNNHGRQSERKHMRNKGRPTTKNTTGRQKEKRQNQKREESHNFQRPSKNIPDETQTKQQKQAPIKLTPKVQSTEKDLLAREGEQKQQVQTKKLPSAAKEEASIQTQVPIETMVSSKPLPPRRGKAKVVCGCFGTKYKALTNCLHCGRIACEKEGYGYCPFCGYLIEKVAIQADDKGNIDPAIIHKERLLKFDREFTRRTVILDDQADYFSSSTSMWLNEDERQNAEDQDKKQRQDLHERKAPKLNIAFE